MKEIKYIFIAIFIVILAVLIKFIFLTDLNKIKRDFKEADEIIVLISYYRKNTLHNLGEFVKICRKIKDKKLKKKIIDILFNKKLKRNYRSSILYGRVKYATFFRVVVLCYKKDEKRYNKIRLIGGDLIIGPYEVYQYADRKGRYIVDDIFELLNGNEASKKEEKLFFIIMKKLQIDREKGIKEAFKIMSESEK